MTLSLVARILAVRASLPVRDAVIPANETGGFKYIPGGREYQYLFWALSAVYSPIAHNTIPPLFRIPTYLYRCIIDLPSAFIVEILRAVLAFSRLTTVGSMLTPTDSHLEGHSQRRNHFPRTLESAWILSLGF